MLRLVESIKLEDGIFHNLQYHQERMDRSVLQLTGRRNRLRLSDELRIPADFSNGLYKCRFVYTDSVELVEFTPYKKRDILTLKIVHTDTDYSCKFEDRSSIDLLFAQRGTCDDVLIIKNEFVTDTSFANIAFSDGVRWYTPARPLLAGTKRSRLLDGGIIEVMDIRLSDLSRFTHASLFNAMIEHEELMIPVSAIS